NLKSLKRPGVDNLKIDNELVGEIDFIIINERLKKIFVADTKYNRARYEAVGYRNDYSNFLNYHEPQLERKFKWVKDNLVVVQNHFALIYGRHDLDLTGFTVDSMFLINTPT